jgi:hypothetical protein
MAVSDLEVAKKFVNLHRSAKDRGLEFNLTLTSVKNLLKAKRDYYTGKRLRKTSVDRVDNTKGYVIGNVVACEESLNLRKGSLTNKEIEQLYKGIKKKETQYD